MWNLVFNEDVFKYFQNGSNNNRRMEKYSEFIRNAVFPALQVGVPTAIDHKYTEEWTSIDLYDNRPCIDHKMDLSDMSFEGNYFSTIACCAVLEHVKNPFKCVSEMYKVAKRGCKIWVEIPFVQSYHPYKGYIISHGILGSNIEFKKDDQHGGDYWRFTPQGLIELMKPFAVLDIMLVNEGGVAFHGVKE